MYVSCGGIWLMIAWYAPLAALLPKYPICRYPIVVNNGAAAQLFSSMPRHGQNRRVRLCVPANIAGYGYEMRRSRSTRASNSSDL